MGFTIQDIIDTLNNIEVHGKANLDRLLSSIMALEAVIEAQKNTICQDEPTEETETKGE